MIEVLSTVRYPLLLIGREGRIQAGSHAAANLLALSPDAIRGKSIGEIAGSHGLLLHNAVASVIASSPRSCKVTVWPACANSRACQAPAMPAPMMDTGESGRLVVCNIPVPSPA